MQSKAYLGPIIEIQCDCEGQHHYYYCLDLFKYTNMKVIGSKKLYPSEPRRKLNMALPKVYKPIQSSKSSFCLTEISISVR